jgi:hypothetical protein
MTLLAAFAIGCGSTEEPAYRVALPDGWVNRTREYHSQFEDRMNAQAPAWARLRVRGIAQDRESRTTMLVAALARPPQISLRVLARRMIRLSNEKVINFELRRRPTAVRVDGAPALIYDFTGSPELGAVHVRVALIRHGGDVHLASVTATPHGFPAGASRLAEVLDSWRWSRPSQQPRAGLNGIVDFPPVGVV